MASFFIVVVFMLLLRLLLLGKVNRRRFHFISAGAFIDASLLYHRCRLWGFSTFILAVIVALSSAVAAPYTLLQSQQQQNSNDFSLFSACLDSGTSLAITIFASFSFSFQRRRRVVSALSPLSHFGFPSLLLALFGCSAPSAPR